MKKITNGLFYENFLHKSNKVHMIKLEQQSNAFLTLLLSKLSEAINPNIVGNHIGAGGRLSDVFQLQKGIRFIINGGFNHYCKDFYDWPHQNYNIGDPVGIVKIREHSFHDCFDTQYYGFLIQKNKGDKWSIVNYPNLTPHCKYILGCTPLLIYKSEPLTIPKHLTAALPVEKINPPSVLAHAGTPHPRTAVAIKDNDIYFINVEGSPGITLDELRLIGMEKKFDALLNLDGGGSAQFKIITDSKEIIANTVSDRDRILGHCIIIFDEQLK